jgi:hypothetical protein
VEFLKMVLGLLGFGNGASIANKALGAVNWIAIAPVLIWIYEHHEDIITFRVDVGTLSLIALAVFVVLELNRRTV